MLCETFYSQHPFFSYSHTPWLTKLGHVSNARQIFAFPSFFLSLKLNVTKLLVVDHATGPYTLQRERNAQCWG